MCVIFYTILQYWKALHIEEIGSFSKLIHKTFSLEVTKDEHRVKRRKDWLIRTGKVTGFSEIITWAQTKWISLLKNKEKVWCGRLRRKGFSEKSHAWGENETKLILRKVWKLRRENLPILIMLSAVSENVNLLLVIKFGSDWKMKCLNFKDWLNL